MESLPEYNGKKEGDTPQDVEESDRDLEFPEEMSMEEKVQRLASITKNQQRKIKAQDEIIKDLVEQVKRRDRILELSSDPGDQVEVVKIDGDGKIEGRRVYEIRNKRKIPYMIKTERLSPTPTQIDWENRNEPKILHGEGATKSTQTQKVQNKEPSVENLPKPINPAVIEDFDDILILDVGLEDGELSDEQTEDKNLDNKKVNVYEPGQSRGQATEENKKSLILEELSRNQKGKKRPQNQGQKRRSVGEKSPRKSIKISVSSDSTRRTIVFASSPERSTSLLSSSRRKAWTSSMSTDHFSHCHPDGTHTVSQVEGRSQAGRSQSGQSYRHSFVFSDDVDSSLLNFWSCDPNSSNIKYLVKLHPGENWDWDRQRFTLIEQNDLDPLDPKVTIMTRRLIDIERKIRLDFPDKTRTILLELEDFPIFSRSFQSYFNLNRIGGFVTHLTLGHRLYSHRHSYQRFTENRKIESNLLLEFIFKYFPALQFLAVSSDSLDFSDDEIPLVESQSEFLLNNLQVLKLLRSKTPDKREQKYSTGFSVKFFYKIWRRSPNLKRVYGIPLEIVEKIGAAAKFNVRSICIASARNQLITGHCYDEQLKIVQEYCGQLEELDTRIFFIEEQKHQLRLSIMRTLSQILEKNAETLKKVKVEIGPKGPCSWLKFPILRNVTTLTFYLHAKSSHFVVPVWDHEINIRTREFEINFSNLKRVKICGATKNAENELDAGIFELDKCFPSRVFSRVESLFLKNVCGAECLAKMINFFPNVRFLRLQYCLKDVNTVLPLVFENMQKLEQMQIEVDTDGCVGLDTGLTGIDPAGLKKLKMDLRFGSCIGQDELFKRAEELRTSRPILELPHLSFLRIVLRPGKSSDQFLASTPIFSPVSAYFGFGFKWTRLGLEAPKLMVQIALHKDVGLAIKEIILDGLEPMQPFVTLEL